MTTSGGGWESLDPWEKAAQWKAVAPEITEDLVRLAKAKAIQDRRDQARVAAEALKAAQFEREMQKEAALRDYELKVQQADLAKKREEREHALEVERLAMQKSLERRLWWLQLISLIGGLAAVAAFIFTGLELSESPTISGGSIAVFGLGSTLATALLGTNFLVNRKLLSVVQGSAETSSPQPTSPVADEGSTANTEGPRQ